MSVMTFNEYVRQAGIAFSEHAMSPTSEACELCGITRMQIENGDAGLACPRFRTHPGAELTRAGLRSVPVWGYLPVRAARDAAAEHAGGDWLAGADWADWVHC